MTEGAHMPAPTTDKAIVERETIRSGTFELRHSVEGNGRPVMVIGSAIHIPKPSRPHCGENRS